MAVAFLGLNILHDTSAAVVVDGELVCAVEEERFNRDRHTAAFPTAAIEHCLDRAGLRREDVRGVGLTFDYEQFRDNAELFDQNVIDHDETRPAGSELIRRLNEDTWREAAAQLARNGFADARRFRHHLTHAACGYYLSGFEQANVLVMDGRGERESTSLWHGHGREIDHLESYPVTESLGHLYTYVTALCGLYGKSGRQERAGHLGSIGNEGKTMGLSGYGTDRISFADVVRFGPERYHVDRDRLRELDVHRAPLGAPDAVSRDLAYGLQKRLEDVYHFLAARLESLTGCRQFVLAGGVALNCNANGALAASPLADDVFIPPAAHDAGAAIGAAFLQWVEHSGERPKAPADQVYLGPAISRPAVREAVGAGGGERVARVGDPAAVAAAALADGLVVGWCQGGMEFGPRALGNRSILADPRDASMPDTINMKVKFREPWRPFAPSVLAADHADWFEPAIRSPYMLLSLAVRPDRRATVPAITHVDGTARVQTVTEEANPLYHRLIDCFRRLTGVPMVLNTSLNIRGEPIARTPQDAVRCFTESGLDLLVVGDTVLWKDGVRPRLDAVGPAGTAPPSVYAPDGAIAHRSNSTVGFCRDPTVAQHVRTADVGPRHPVLPKGGPSMPENATTTGTPLVHKMVEAQAAAHPDAIALRWSDGELTYRQVQASIQQFARHLNGAHRAALLNDRSPEFVIAVLAVLASGGGYVPLDTTYPRRRLDYMLANSGADRLLCRSSLSHLITVPDGCQLELLDDVVVKDIAQEDLGAADMAPSTAEVSAEDTAYVTYTSGSTGWPKGLEMPQRALANIIAWQVADSGSTVGWNTLQLWPLSVDVASQEIMATWASGGTVVLVSEETRSDWRDLLRYIDEQKINRVYLSFTTLYQVIEAAHELELYPTALHEVITAGEQLQINESVQSFFAKTGGRLQNQYGMTETHIVSANTLSGDPGTWPSRPSIGRAIDNMVVEVVDENMEPVPPGGEGELCIAGPQVPKGYINLPEMTEKKFRPWPARDTVAFMSGDYARRLPDGDIEFIGRRDTQVKINSNRIELEEIEIQLRALDEVSDALVTAHTGGKNQFLVAHYILAPDADIDGEELRRRLTDVLPHHFVPDRYQQVDEFPFTPVGKVDRNAMASQVTE